jgi:endoglucanase
MKRIIIIFSVILCFCTFPVISQTPFSRGVNLTGWFQASSSHNIQFTKFTKQDLINIKNLGCDVIRFPINLHFMTDGEPDYNLDPLFLFFLDSVVTWAENLQIHLLLDNHTFDPDVDTDPSVEQVLIRVWTQMAEHYKDRSEYIYYEILNEPHGISDVTWGNIQQNVIDAIREVDTEHTIIVGPAGFNSYNNLDDLPEYTDDKLIYTFHFYDPFLFTHQGASWTDPSMEPLAGVPFPYNADSMPDCPAELQGTWIQNAFSNYYQEGTAERVKELIDIAADFKTSRNVSIFCGEFGVYIPNSPRQDRINWYDTVRSYLEEKEIPWTIWDYTGGFGIFEEGGNNIFEHDIDTAIVRALGLDVPEQSEYIFKPDSTGFLIYSDYIERQIVGNSWGQDLITDYYSEISPDKGNYCLHWAMGNQYSTSEFDFIPDKDLSELLAEDYAVDFMIRGTYPGSEFDIRFLDTKTDDPDDHPWRMRYTINDAVASWDGRWYHLHIPLSDFTEQGSWDNDQWFNPVGDYDWTAVNSFEIVAEHHDLTGMHFWFDNIHVTDMDTASVSDTSVIMSYIPPEKLVTNPAFSVYPNPANENTVISYSVYKKGKVEINIYDVSGKMISSLVNHVYNPGDYSVIWQCKNIYGNRIRSGMYFCTIVSPGFTFTEKVSVIR